MEVISFFIWLIVNFFIMGIFGDHDNKKVFRCPTKREWKGIAVSSVFTFFLFYMHACHEDLLGRIYTYIGVAIFIAWSIAFIFFGIDPRKK